MSHTSDFSRAMDFVIEWEGREGEVTRDTGGWTKYGISLRFLRQARLDLDRDGDVDKDDVLWVDYKAACDIYYRYFWQLGCSALPWPVNLVVFDAAVNCSPRRSARWLQRAINRQLPHDPLIEDGVIGPKTLHRLNQTDLKELVKAALQFRLEYYQDLGRHPKHAPFLEGWKNRVEDLKEEVLR